MLSAMSLLLDEMKYPMKYLINPCLATQCTDLHLIYSRPCNIVVSSVQEMSQL